MAPSRLARASLLLLLPVIAAAQERTEKPKGPIVVKITTLHEGKVVTVEDEKTGKKELRTVDRRVQWLLGKEAIENVEQANKLLVELAMQPASLRLDRSTGGRKLAALKLDPGPNVRWEELVRTYDAGLDAGFKEIEVVSVEAGWWELMAINEPVVDKRNLSVPGAVHGEFDDDDWLEEERPVFDVRRDGSIAHGGKELFRKLADEVADVGVLRRALKKLRDEHEAAGDLVKRPVGKRLSTPVMVRADRMAKWRDVRRVLSELLRPEVGFLHVHLAVAEIVPERR